VQSAAAGARGSHCYTGIRRLDTTQASVSAAQDPSIPLDERAASSQLRRSHTWRPATAFVSQLPCHMELECREWGRHAREVNRAGEKVAIRAGVLGAPDGE